MKNKLLKILEGMAEAVVYLMGLCAFVGALYMICDGRVKIHVHFACAKQCQCDK